MRSRSRKQNYLRKNIYQTNKIIFGIKKAYTDKNLYMPFYYAMIEQIAHTFEVFFSRYS